MMIPLIWAVNLQGVCLLTTATLNKASIIGLILMRLQFIFMIPVIHNGYSLSTYRPPS